MSARPWMPLYCADYLADTAHLGALESGGYLHLIMHYWLKGQLPDDDRQLARIARMTDAEWSEHRLSIASFFKLGWKHARVEKELAEAKAAYEKRANAGRKGGKSSKAEPMQEQCESNASAMQKQSPSPSPSSFQEESCADTRDLNEIEAKCRAAAKCEQATSPGLCVLAPILGLMDGGADLERDILPALRAKPYARAGSWNYFIGQIQDFRAQRLAAANPVQPRAREGPPPEAKTSTRAKYLDALLRTPNDRTEPEIVQ